MVRMLSTFHSAQELPSGRPKIVNNYNKNMGGVDTTDAIMKAYSGQRNNKKVHQKIILHLFHLQQSFSFLPGKLTTPLFICRIRLLRLGCIW
jgi:hypothetical protein